MWFHLWRVKGATVLVMDTEIGSDTKIIMECKCITQQEGNAFIGLS